VGALEIDNPWFGLCGHGPAARAQRLLPLTAAGEAPQVSAAASKTGDPQESQRASKRIFCSGLGISIDLLLKGPMAPFLVFGPFSGSLFAPLGGAS
jgi:hypothetical protein